MGGKLLMGRSTVPPKMKRHSAASTSTHANILIVVREDVMQLLLHLCLVMVTTHAAPRIGGSSSTLKSPATSRCFRFEH